MLSIPLLIEPGCDLNGQVVWAASVVHYQHGSTDMEQRFDLEALALNHAGSSCLSVIDIWKRVRAMKMAEMLGYAWLHGTYCDC